MTKIIACPVCDGRGWVQWTNTTNDVCSSGSESCPHCGGTGQREVPMTNADRMNAMSIEEKAAFIVDEVLDIHHEGMRETAYDGWLKWLQQPCEAVQPFNERPDGQS